jgi:hypothetical protein
MISSAELLDRLKELQFELQVQAQRSQGCASKRFRACEEVVERVVNMITEMEGKA